MRQFSNDELLIRAPSSLLLPWQTQTAERKDPSPTFDSRSPKISHKILKTWFRWCHLDPKSKSKLAIVSLKADSKAARGVVATLLRLSKKIRATPLRKPSGARRGFIIQGSCRVLRRLLALSWNAGTRRLDGVRRKMFSYSSAFISAFSRAHSRGGEPRRAAPRRVGQK